MICALSTFRILTFKTEKRLTTPETLGKARPYVFLGAFVVGMLLTPPDVISQTLLAVPIYLLYEAGIIMSRIMLSDKKSEQTE